MKWFIFEIASRALSVFVCINEFYFWRVLPLLFCYGILESNSGNGLPEGFHHIRDYVFSIGLGRVIHVSFTVVEVAISGGIPLDTGL